MISDEEQELRNITGAVMTVAFKEQIEPIILLIEEIENHFIKQFSDLSIEFGDTEKEVLFKSIIRGIEMRKERGKLPDVTETN